MPYEAAMRNLVGGWVIVVSGLASTGCCFGGTSTAGVEAAAAACTGASVPGAAPATGARQFVVADSPAPGAPYALNEMLNGFGGPSSLAEVTHVACLSGGDPQPSGLSDYGCTEQHVWRLELHEAATGALVAQGPFVEALPSSCPGLGLGGDVAGYPDRSSIEGWVSTH